MRSMLAKVLFPDPAWSCAAATSAVGAMLSQAGEVAVQLLGVPLPVVLGAFAGAFLARAYAPPTGFWTALGMSLLWTVAGCALAPVAGAITIKFGFELPAGALAAAAFAISSLGPAVLPIVIDRVQARVRAKIDNGSQSGPGGQP